MSTVTVPQVNQNDEVTALSVNQGPNALAAVVNGQIDDANVSTLSGSKISSGTLPASALDTNSNPITRANEQFVNFVASGVNVSATSGLNVAITAGIVYINGARIAVPIVSSQALTASKDTYIDITSSGTVSLVVVSNNATSGMTLTPNSVRVAKVVTSDTAVTSVQQWGVGPLGVYIYNTSPYAAPVSIYNNTNGIAMKLYYRNQSGIKEAWGRTAVIPIGGTGFQNVLTGFDLPSSFFNAVSTINLTVDSPSNTQYLLTTANQISNTRIDLNLTQLNGTNGSGYVNVYIRGF